jgi:hypothetical protein
MEMGTVTIAEPMNLRYLTCSARPASFRELCKTECSIRLESLLLEEAAFTW